MNMRQSISTRHIIKDEKNRRYGKYESLKSDAKARKRFEAVPMALQYQEQINRRKELAALAFDRHRAGSDTWEEGAPVKSWYDADKNLCVQYESGNWWHYKDLDMPFPTWW